MAFTKIRNRAPIPSKLHVLAACTLALQCLMLLSALVIVPIGAAAQSDAGQRSVSDATSPVPVASGTCPVAAVPSPTPSSTPTVSAINFSPAVVTLNNPTSPLAKKGRSSIKLVVSAYDNNGNVLKPSRHNPLYVKIDGAPGELIKPSLRKITSGDVAEFEYSGKYFPNPINVEAWIKIPSGTATLGQYALGITQILGQNQNACAYGSKSFPLAVNCGTEPADQCATDNITSSHGIQVMAAVGYADAKKASFKPYTVDTGSLGVIVPIGELPTGAAKDWIGPGAPGEKMYTSNAGKSFTGNYYLAPVSLKLSNGGVVQTSRVMVLVLSADQSLNYLGVGFNLNPA